MMSSLWCRALSAVVGVAVFAAAGWVLGGWWWAAAGAGIAAAVSAQFDQRMGYPMVVAALAASVGSGAAGEEWLVVLVVAGVVASLELAAGADRVTVVRPRVPVVGRAAAATAGAVVLAGAVVVIGGLDGVTGAWTAVAAAATAVVALRLLTR